MAHLRRSSASFLISWVEEALLCIRWPSLASQIHARSDGYGAAHRGRILPCADLPHDADYFRPDDQNVHVNDNKSMTQGFYRIVHYLNLIAAPDAEFEPFVGMTHRKLKDDLGYNACRGTLRVTNALYKREGQPEEVVAREVDVDVAVEEVVEAARQALRRRRRRRGFGRRSGGRGGGGCGGRCRVENHHLHLAGVGRLGRFGPEHGWLAACLSGCACGVGKYPGGTLLLVSYGWISSSATDEAAVASRRAVRIDSRFIN